VESQQQQQHSWQKQLWRITPLQAKNGRLGSGSSAVGEPMPPAKLSSPREEDAVRDLQGSLRTLVATLTQSLEEQ